MTLAATAPVSDNHTAIWVVLALLAVFAIVAVLWQHETVSDRHGRAINKHDEQLATLAYQMPALLDWLGVEIPPPVSDDSPEAREAEAKPDEMPTDEFPVAPPTVPDGIPLAVQSALIEQRPSPVPRTDSDEAKARKAAWVESELAKVRARIDAGRGAS